MIWQHEEKTYSQNGEDGIIAYLFDEIGTTNKYFVEFGVIGAEAELECNTRLLLEKGWQGVMFDPQPSDEPFIFSETITAENVNEVFAKYRVPDSLDFLSVDVDGNDYWILKALEYEPRAVVVEYNAEVPNDVPRCVPYDPGYRWDGTDHFGCNCLALVEMMRQKGYAFVGCESRGVNAFFVHKNAETETLHLPSLEEGFRPRNYPAHRASGKLVPAL